MNKKGLPSLKGKRVLIVMYVLFCIFCFHRANWHASATLTESDIRHPDVFIVL